jgi:hypothetical protein
MVVYIWIITLQLSDNYAKNTDAGKRDQKTYDCDTAVLEVLQVLSIVIVPHINRCILQTVNAICGQASFLEFVLERILEVLH